MERIGLGEKVDLSSHSVLELFHIMRKSEGSFCQQPAKVGSWWSAPNKVITDMWELAHYYFGISAVMVESWLEVNRQHIPRQICAPLSLLHRSSLTGLSLTSKKVGGDSVFF